MRALFNTVRRLGLPGLLASAVVALCMSPARADETAASYRLAVGGDATFALQENPSTGYRWHLNPAASRELPLIEVSDAGTVRGSGADAVHPAIVGAPGQRSFRIVARQPGTAVAVFDYLRDWEKLGPVHRHTVTVEIADR